VDENDVITPGARTPMTGGAAGSGRLSVVTPPTSADAGTPEPTATSAWVLATIVLVAMLIGGNFTALKFALDHAGPLLITALRTVIGGSFLVAFALLRGERFPTDRVILGRIFVVGFSITTVSSSFLVSGVSRVPAGFASLMSSTMPLFTAVLSLLLLGTHLGRFAIVGLFVGFGGTAVLASPALDGDAQLVGAAALLFSALAWAFGTVFMKWRDFSQVTPIMLVGVQLLMSACMLLPFALVVEGAEGTDWSPGLFVPLLYAAIPANAVTFALMATVVRRATPTQAAGTAYLIPLFGVFFGWLIRDERLGATELVGGVLVVAGVTIVVTAAAPSARRILPASRDPDRSVR
jgi:drug/metabolite transporter (DMT)-like permease